MNWLSNLFHSFLAWFPRLWYVEPDESGIRVTLGKYVKVCKPGWYIWWPILQTIRKIIIVCQLVDLKNQSLRTKDGVSIIISGGIQYTVKDVEKTLLDVHDYDKGIQVKALDIIAKYVKERTLEQCQDFASLKDEVKRGLAESVKRWGIRMEDVMITDLVEGRSLRVMSDSQTIQQFVPLEN